MGVYLRTKNITPELYLVLIYISLKIICTFKGHGLRATWPLEKENR